MKIRFTETVLLEIDTANNGISQEDERVFTAGEEVECIVQGLGSTYPCLDFPDGTSAMCVDSDLFEVIEE